MLAQAKNTMAEEEVQVTDPAAVDSTIGNPFAAREGKTLTWRNVQMSVALKAAAKKKDDDAEPGDKVILRDVWGEVPAKATTAIMGPSGAGKTSLLNILAGRATSGGKLTVRSDVRLNNVQVDPTSIEFRKQIAFVTQDDSLMVSATPRECIRFSAKLRLDNSTSDDEIEKLAEHMLQDLGLDNCADTLVGGELLKGISGGERKRTSVGVELITKPDMVFLDEPTSGLDSFSAVQLCQVLKKVANSGASVMFTIHQPSSDIFESFDNLILMNKGRIMYQGAVAAVDEYFGARGRPLPPKYNPADWIMIVAQSVLEDELEANGFFEDNPLPAIEAEIAESSLSATKQHVSLFTQLKLLVSRDIKSLKRDKQVLGVRIMLTLFTSVLVGIIFWQIGEVDSSDFTALQSHFGAEIMVLMISLLSTALPVMVKFPAERPVFVREYSTNHYSVFAYFLSRLVMEILLTGIQVILLAVLSKFMVGFQIRLYWHFLILYAMALTSNALAVGLGSTVSDPKLAIEFLPMLIMPQLLFAGFFIAVELIPIWLRWLTWVMPLTYAVRLHMEQEFEDCGSVPAQVNCDRLLDNADVNTDLTWLYWLVLLCIFAVVRLFALLMLRNKATKFY